MIYTEADFDRLSWHDCHIWGIELRAGLPPVQQTLTVAPQTEVNSPSTQLARLG